MIRVSRLLTLAAATALAACARGEASDDGLATASTADAMAAAGAITADGIMQHTMALSADSMEGRGPGTPGEDKTVAYLESAFRAMGLQPGNPDGSYIQNVGMIGYSASPTASFTAGGRRIALRWPEDYVANSRHNRAESRVDASDMVFVGYGIVAPEYGWNDYDGVDVRGKTVVILINDPQLRAGGAAPSDTTAALDTAMFKGKAMTYYGRWTYKYEEATRQGAAAAIIIHETGPAGYPYDVVKGSWAREQLDVMKAGENDRVAVEGWITEPKARELLTAAGQDFDALKTAATTPGFKPVPLSATADFRIGISVRQLQSRNVVAMVPGTDLNDEYVVYTAHWDHLGRDTLAAGDQIYNGALDNASGTAAMLEIARAFTTLKEKPRRSVVFLAVTAEEKGLLGAKYYAENPLYPLAKTVANINLDGVNQWGRTTDMTIVGLGNSTLDDLTTSILSAENRTVRPDPEPEKGFYYRSDHFEFAKLGVPALYVDAGVEFIGRDSTYGMQKRDQYTNVDYHKPSDEVKPDWDLSGAVEDARVLFRVGVAVANGRTFPAWKPGTEFKARRDAMLSGNR
jgi:Zn-dependent M28 family amino/carboxypeptidase